MNNTKQQRVLEIFFRGMRGEDISVRALANEYGVSTKSITRSINELKAFLADHKELVGDTKLIYSYADRCYRLYMDELLNSKELFAITEVLIGARAFSREELLVLVNKFKHFTIGDDKQKLTELIRKELYHYSEVKHDCESVQDRLWQLINCITEKKTITVEYYRMDRKWITRKLYPLSVLFNDYYFYLIAFCIDGASDEPRYFRIDRIKEITVHRKNASAVAMADFDEGLLRKRSLFMWPGTLRTVRFEFNGPSVQAVLDKLPTAKILKRMDGGKYLIEAETYGDGIKMWLLGQGAWVKVVSPVDFVAELRDEINKMHDYYNL
ncbi:MAG: WYL domain-containing transcriptional regulator [Clostridia bacterium]|nr:WYL domain-containing transcriptional regulator [Clostridia bacterium]